MIEVRCIRNDGNKEMPTIENDMIISDAMAVRRGTYEIDKQWFMVHTQEIEVPHKNTDNDEALMSGDIINIFNSDFSISGNRLIRKIVISGDKDSIINRITISNFEEYSS